jgi:hypothetical protein
VSGAAPSSGNGGEKAGNVSDFTVICSTGAGILPAAFPLIPYNHDLFGPATPPAV